MGAVERPRIIRDSRLHSRSAELYAHESGVCESSGVTNGEWIALSVLQHVGTKRNEKGSMDGCSDKHSTFPV